MRIVTAEVIIALKLDFGQIFLHMSGDTAVGVASVKADVNRFTKLLLDELLIAEKFVEIINLDISIDRFVWVIDGARDKTSLFVNDVSFQDTIKQVALVGQFLDITGRFLPLVHIIELDVSAAHFLR